MLIKLSVIVGIIVFGSIIFSDELLSIYPNFSEKTFNSFKDDLSNFSLIASDSVEKKIDSSFDKIVDKTGDAISNEISEAGDKISDEISDVKDSSKQKLDEKLSDFNPIESIKDIFSDNPNVEELTDSSTVTTEDITTQSSVDSQL